MSNITELDFGFYNIGGLTISVTRNKLGNKQITIVVPFEMDKS